MSHPAPSVEVVDLTVVIPAYNEELRILPTLERLHTHLSTQDMRSIAGRMMLNPTSSVSVSRNPIKRLGMPSSAASLQARRKLDIHASKRFILTGADGLITKPSGFIEEYHLIKQIPQSTRLGKIGKIG